MCCTAWVNSKRITYTYDAAGGMLTYLVESWDQGVWTTSNLMTGTNDTKGNPLVKIYQEWEDSVMVYTFRVTNSYDGIS